MMYKTSCAERLDDAISRFPGVNPDAVAGAIQSWDYYTTRCSRDEGCSAVNAFSAVYLCFAPLAGKIAVFDYTPGESIPEEISSDGIPIQDLLVHYLRNGSSWRKSFIQAITDRVTQVYAQDAGAEAPQTGDCRSRMMRRPETRSKSAWLRPGSDLSAATAFNAAESAVSPFPLTSMITDLSAGCLIHENQIPSVQNTLRLYTEKHPEDSTGLFFKLYENCDLYRLASVLPAVDQKMLRNSSCDHREYLKFRSASIRCGMRLDERGDTVIASVRFTSHGNLVQLYEPTAIIPERFLRTIPVCDYTGQKTLRPIYYIIRTGCEDGHLELLDCESITRTYGVRAMRVSVLDRFFRSAQSQIKQIPWELGVTPVYYPCRELLSYCYECARIYGYQKQDREKKLLSTGERAVQIYRADHEDLFGRAESGCLEVQSQARLLGFNPDSDECRSFTDQKISGCNALMASENSYVAQLGKVCSQEFVPASKVGLVASMIRFREPEASNAKPAERKSTGRYVGNVGDSIVIDVKMHRVLKTSVSIYTGRPAYLYAITDADGNQYIWNTEKELDGSVRSIRATVKGHQNYHGSFQTVITRGFLR